MKKILMIVLAILIAFAMIRIGTSTYENIKRNHENKIQENESVVFVPNLIIYT